MNEASELTETNERVARSRSIVLRPWRPWKARLYDELSCDCQLWAT